jgi:RHH-type transcriptional regulator, proline utilization regulon repressor / proline dehydrogenase / delta 1-pyrroline-5-carboxylate dehydrogenase
MVVMTTALALEADVQAIARQLAEKGRDERAGAFHLGWWSEHMLAWAMAHPDFKTQLFRLVDVLPACRDDTEVLRHIDEYFQGVPVPRALELGIDAAEQVPLGSLVTAVVARRSVLRMARQFIAGATPERALRRFARLWQHGEATTVDLLGEKVVSDQEADRYASRLLEVVETLVGAAAGWPTVDVLERDPWGRLPKVNVSVKPTALSPRFTPLTGEEGLADAFARLRTVLDVARAGGATVHLDVEHDEAKDLTLELLRLVGSQYGDVQLGCVVQAYRKDAFDDLRDLVSWSHDALAVPLQIRLVKGAYWDQERIVAGAAGWPAPVFEQIAETEANYERCTRYLIDHAGEVRPAIASHNLRSLAHAIAAARAAGLDDAALEFQLLYGMAEPVHTALTRMGRRVRVYAPIGELVPGMGYLVRRLLENTSNEGFVRQSFVEGRAIDELVAPPAIGEAALPAAALDVPPRPATDADHPGPFRNEPHAELRRPAPRTRLVRAVRSRLDEPAFSAPLVIEGRARHTSDKITSVDPGRPERVVCRSSAATSSDADDAIDIARRAWPAWRDAPWRERAAVLFRTAAILRDRRAELTALEAFEAGKPLSEADADVCEAIDFCEYYGRRALRMASGAPIDQAPGERNAYRYEPRGIGLVISPWNFPLAIPTGMVTAALVTGNAVLFKPAEQTPGIALRLVEALHEAGLPPGVLAFLPGVGEDVGAYMVDHPEVSFIVFTGSKAVGLQIVERAAVPRAGQRHIKRVIAEMGGKNAVIVDADADLDVAIPAIVHSALAYAGQKCSAASRAIALAPVFDEFVDRLVGASAVVPVGHPSELRTVCGPLIDSDAYARVLEFRALAHIEGEVLLERDDHPSVGWYVGPTVALIDEPKSRIATEEIFGPLLTVLRATDWDHALALANDTDYALTGGVFSRSPTRITHAVRTMRAGNVYVNRGITGALVGRQPFGGYGLSGVGSKAGGPDYLLQFVEPRSVTENTVRQGFAPLQETP